MIFLLNFNIFAFTGYTMGMQKWANLKVKIPYDLEL